MQSIEIKSFVLSEADDPVIDSWFRLQRESWLETNPGEPVFSRKELIPQWLACGEGMDQAFFHASDPSGRMLGTCSLSRTQSGERDRFAFVNVLVDPGFRRQGLGSRLFRHITAVALAKGCDTLSFRTHSMCPAGMAMARNLGARSTHEDRVNRLTLADVDRNLLKKWLTMPLNDSPGIVVSTWKSDPTDERFQQIASFYQEVHDVNRGEPDFREHTFTAEQVAQGEKAARVADKSNLSLYCHGTESKQLLGLSYVYWFPSRPLIINQGYTAVLPAVRCRGIARRLKAEMLTRLFELVPEACYLKSHNSDDNRSILKINTELGFRHIHTTTIWELKIKGKEPGIDSGSEAAELLN